MMTGNEPVNATSTLIEGHVVLEGGLSIRQHFAAMAMQGLVAFHGTMGNAGSAYSTAQRSVEIADALIAELNKE